MELLLVPGAMGSVASLIDEDTKPGKKKPLMRRATVFMDDMDNDNQFKVKEKKVTLPA